MIGLAVSLSGLWEDGSISSPDDRRAFVRYSTDLGTFCQPGKEGRMDHFWRLARVQDVSVNGIRLVLAIKFEPGTILTVELLDRETSHLAQAQVIHAQSQNPEGWVTGCSFVNPLSENDLKGILS